MNDYRCDAHHDQHNCSEPGACTRALIALCERTQARTETERTERERHDRQEAA